MCAPGPVPCHHALRDWLRHVQRTQAIDADDVVDFCRRGLSEGHGDCVGAADIVNEDANIQGFEEGGQFGEVGGGRGTDVNGIGTHGCVEFGLDICGHRAQFVGAARDQHGRVACPGQLHGEFPPNAIRGAGDHRPGLGGGAE